jgi:acyl phosphate:glycerol-3-phosphate acyltransferase
MGIFLITLFASKFVSLSSMIAGLSFPILIIFLFQTNSSSMAIFSVVTFILLLITHQKNIERLFAGKESRADFLKRKTNSSEFNLKN